MIWNKKDLDQRYQVITFIDDPDFDAKLFAAYKKIPEDQFAYADLDFTDDLKRDFPNVKPE